MTGTLAGAVLRGIRSRSLLSVGSVLLIVLAIGSALLGPVFQVAVTKSYVVSRLDDAPPRATGVSRELVPALTFEGGPRAGVDVAVEDALTRVEGPFGPPTAQLETTRVEGGVNNPDGAPGMVKLLARDDACDHLEITGRCPTSPGQALVLAGDAEYSRLEVGDHVPLTGGVPAVTVVGTYRVPAAEEDFWYDVTRFDSVPRRVDDISGDVQPYEPGPLVVDPSAFDAVPDDTWRVRVDRRLEVPPDWTEADLRAAAAAGRAVAGEPVEIEGATLVGSPLGDLPALLAEVRSQEDTARSSIDPAVLSVVLVALALLLRLLTAASELRLPELALASLRGVTERRLWALGLVEPMALLLLAVPLGVAGGIALALVLARWWLVPGLPLPLPLEAWASAGAVTLAAAAVAVVAVGQVLRETLASQLGGLKRPAAQRRTALVAELALFATAAGMLVAQLSAEQAGQPDLTDMALPVVLAVVAGLLATRLIAAIARRSSRRSSRSLPGFVTARALSRRREGTLVVLPVTAAIAIGVFAVGVYDSASDWRASVAATSAPADELWTTSLTMSQAIDLTQQLDPEGAHLMALGQFVAPGARLSVVDGPRLASVLGWPADWTPGTTPQQVQELVQSRGTTPRFAGRRVGLVVDQQLTTESEVTVEMRLSTTAGETNDIYLGPLRPGASLRSEPTPYCRSGCRVERLTLGGPAASKITMSGTFVVEDLLVDGEPLPGAMTEAGWSLSEGVGSQLGPGQTVDISADDGAGAGELRIDVDSAGTPAFVRMAPGELAARRPVVVGARADALLGDEPDNPTLPVSGVAMPVRKVLAAESLPLFGPSGVLIDYRMLVSDRLIYNDVFTVYIATDADTPAALRTALVDRGLSVARTLAEERANLDQGAYALALRLYAVAAVLVLLMAISGLFVSTAVQLPARRRDAAAMRVVGVPRRVVVSAAAREFLAVLGGAAVAGIAAGALAQYVVLRTIRLGYVEALATPRLVPSVDVVQLAIIAAAATAAFGVFALVSATLTVRGARGATLRENAR